MNLMMLEVGKTNLGNSVILIMGTIKSFTKEESEGLPTKITLTGMVKGDDGKYTSKDIEIKFWDEKVSSPNKNAKRLINSMDIELGTPLSVLVYHNNLPYFPYADNYTAMAFKFSGMWKFRAEENRPEKNVIIGNIKFLKITDGAVSFWMYTPDQSGENKENRFVYIKNTDNRKTADYAAKLLDENSFVCAVCGAETELDNRKFYNCYQFYKS